MVQETCNLDSTSNQRGTAEDAENAEKKLRQRISLNDFSAISALSAVSKFRDGFPDYHFFALNTFFKSSRCAWFHASSVPIGNQNDARTTWNGSRAASWLT